MALTDENGGGGIPATMLVGPASFGNGPTAYPYPVYGGFGGGSNSGMGNGWGDGAWIILLIIVLLAAGGGWGNNSGGGGGFGQPIVVNDGGGYGAVQRGFDQAAIMAALSGIQSGICSGFGDVQNSLCSGFAGVNATVNGGFANAETAANARQMANMQQIFGLQSQFADCCCENRLATADLRYTIATENCADRAAISDGIRDVIENCNRNNQRILDQLCADKIDAKNERIADLERQLTAANLAASQIAQTSQITDSIYNRLSTCPVGTVPVYGEQPIFRCNNNGCGCGGMGGYNGNF